LLRYDEAVDDCTEERAHLRRLWRDTMPIAEPLAVGGRTYLQGHGIPAETAIAARVRFADLWGDKDDYAGPAVVFSLQDSAGKLVAAEGRFMTPPAGVAEPLHVGFAEHGVFEVLPGAFAVVARRAACPAQRLREPRPLPKSRRRQDCGDMPIPFRPVPRVASRADGPCALPAGSRQTPSAAASTFASGCRFLLIRCCQ
jgi:hypothetical protein